MKDLLKLETFEELLQGLRELGWRPGLYSRGKLWRAHTQVGSNCWHDGRTPVTAMKGAIRTHLLYEKNFGPLPKDHQEPVLRIFA